MNDIRNPCSSSRTINIWFVLSPQGESDYNGEQAAIPRADRGHPAEAQETEEHSEDEGSSSEAHGDGIERNDAGKFL